MFKLGDIFVTRNEKEEDNAMPGYWNHTAIYTNNGIVEAQMPPWDSVICSKEEEFLNRYPEINVYRWSEKNGVKAAEAAIPLVGTPYRMFASIFRFLRHGRGENCVSVVRQCYKHAHGVDPRWKTPDQISKDRRLTLVWQKKNRR